jgi:hypothetical protein
MQRFILQPFDKRECISLKEPADVAGKSESTLRGWCEKHGLGRRIGGGPWSVSKVALAMFLDGDKKALQAYHAGDRTGAIVKADFERVGWRQAERIASRRPTLQQEKAARAVTGRLVSATAGP